mgnify:CR=1 FL=1
MFISTGFTFNGTHSSMYNIKQVRFTGGFFEQTMSPSRTILEEVVSSRSKPFFYGVESTPITFTLNFIKEGQ